VALSEQSERRVDEIVARAQAEGRSPSVVAGIVRDGSLVYVSHAGDPVAGPEAQFRLGSITKTFTAAVLLGLRDEGRLSLDDPLEAHLPGTAAAVVTVRTLLSHVGGLQREPDGLWWERNPGVSVQELVNATTADKVACPSYTRYHYSSLGYGLLGAVIEQITGMSWWDAVATRLTGPLHMARTTYQAEEPFSRGYVVHPVHATLREEPRHDHVAMAPAGQMWTTVADLAVWGAFLADPRPDVLSVASAASMATPAVIVDPDAWTTGAGLGMQLWRRGERIFVGHTGSMPGYLAVLALHRPSRTGAVAFANTYSLLSGTISGLGLSLVEAVLDSEPAPSPAPWQPGLTPPPEIEALCGPWWWMGQAINVWMGADGELCLASSPDPACRFVAEGPDTWRGQDGDQAGEILRVLRTSDGMVTGLDLSTYVMTREPPG
jgi:CubicO group peptidase (beta-lactamase class C family)